MILTRLSATHFRRFDDLELASIPRRGLIAILGPNEAGKTTVGDAIGFALFGRIPHGSLASGSMIAGGGTGDPAGLIRWDADFAEIELDFEVAGRGAFRVFREIDRTGEHLALLEAIPRGAVITGAGAVNRAIEELFGGRFEDYCATMHRAQGDAGQVAGLAERRAAGDRLSGILACRRAAAEAAHRVAELLAERTRVASELAAQGLAAEDLAALHTAGSDGCAAERAEATLLATIEQGESEAGILETEIAASGVRLARARERLVQREEIARRLDAFRAMIDAREVGRELVQVGVAAAKALEAIPAARSEAGTRLAEARSRIASAIDWRTALERFEKRVAARREEVERQLTGGRSGSLEDERARAVAEIGRFESCGRTALALGIAGGAAAGALAGAHHLPAPLGVMADARSIAFLFAGASALIFRGAALVVLLGLGQQRFGSRRAAIRRVELEMLDRRLGDLKRERALLRGESSRDLRELLRSGALAGSASRALREHAERVVRDFPELVPTAGMADGAPGAESATETTPPAPEVSAAQEAEVELRALREREAALRESLQVVVDRRADLRPWVEWADGAPPTALPTQSPDLTFQVALIERSLSAFPSLPPEAVAACRALVELAAADGMGTGLMAETLLDGVTALSDALPHEGDLAGDVEGLAADHAHRVAQLAAFRDHVAEARRELAARSAEFATGRERRVAADRLAGRALELDRALERERLAQELLEETAHEIRRQLAAELSRSMSAGLERLTAGRYRRVVVDPELRIQIESGERPGLIAAEELSSGTRAQLELAMRLAQAAVHVDRRGSRGEQFVFLDEPFGDFDPARLRAGARFLHEHLDTFGQIFLTATDPAFARAAADHVIDLSGDVAFRRPRAAALAQDVAGVAPDGSAPAIPADHSMALSSIAPGARPRRPARVSGLPAAVAHP